MYSSYPEDTQDTILTRIEESNVKWVLCDAGSVPQVKQAIAQVPWAVEIMVIGDVDDCTNISEIFEDDGAGKYLACINLHNILVVNSY